MSKKVIMVYFIQVINTPILIKSQYLRTLFD